MSRGDYRGWHVRDREGLVPVCVQCGTEVQEALGAWPERHLGHLIPSKDSTCGWWEFVRVSAEHYGRGILPAVTP